MKIGEKEKRNINRVMDNGVLSEYQGNWSNNFHGGTQVRRLEAEWSSLFSCRAAVPCNSATSGLYIALAAVGLQRHLLPGFDGCRNGVCPIPGDEFSGPPEVLVTPYSMTCSASMPLMFGARPVFVDIDPDYFCMDPIDMEAKITPRTAAVIAVDLLGHPIDPRIADICHERGIPLIEDAAQAIGAIDERGRNAGLIGDIGVFSLNRHKHIQSGEGGIVATNDPRLETKIRLVMNHAEAVMNGADKDNNIFRYPFDDDDFLLVGGNFRMTETTAAIARAQLESLPGVLRVVRAAAEGIPVKVRPGCVHSYYRYAHTGPFVDVPDTYLRKEGYITPIYNMPLFQRLGYRRGQCPVCELVNGQIKLYWLKDMP